METAKVDIRKLQLLNDRINQCIDALAQVRLSVHGLSHSNPAGQMSNVGGFGIGTGINPFSQQQINPNIGTPYLGSPYGFGQGQSQGFGQIGVGQQNPFWGQQTGLSHSSPELEYSRSPWADPYLAARVTQTFPYLSLQVPPVVSLV